MRMSVSTSWDIWRSWRYLCSVISLDSDDLERLYWNCKCRYNVSISLNLTHTLVGALYGLSLSSTSISHMPAVCRWATNLTSPLSLAHSLKLPTLFLHNPKAFTATTNPPLPPETNPRSTNNATPTYQGKNPNLSLSPKWPQPASPTTTASSSPPPGTASRPSQK